MNDNDWLTEIDSMTARSVSDSDSEPPYVPDCESGDGIIRTQDQMEDFAKQLGMDIKYAHNMHLFVDIDSEEAWKQFQHVFPVVGREFCTGKKWCYDCVVTPSKSGLPKRHIVVKLQSPQTLMTRIALQAALGSDGRREAISVVRALRNEDNVVVFFEPGEMAI